MKTTRIYEDGWHTICGHEVYVEDGYVMRGVSPDGQRTTWVYIRSKNGGWDNASGELTVSAFKSRYYRDTVRMF